MSTAKACPSCGGTQTTKGKVDQWRCLNAFDLVPMAPWTCSSCAHVWEPPAPKWLLVFLLVLGGLVLGMATLAFALGGRSLLRTLLSVVLGLVLLVSSAVKLWNRAPTTITQGRKPGDTP